LLWIDRQPADARAALMSRLEKGEVVSERLQTRDQGKQIDAPGALIHHWIGTVLLPGARLDRVKPVVQNYNRYSEWFTPLIRRAQVTAHTGDRFLVAMRTEMQNVLTVTVVADYAPGIDAVSRITKTFKAGGGEISGTLRTPLQNPDFSAAIQRVKDAKPQAVFVFLPAGEQGIAFVKAFNERGLAKDGIKLIATGDITDDHVLDAMGDPTLGLITSFHYSAAHASPENAALLKAYAEANDAKVGRANFMAAAGYDTMAAIYEAIRKGGDADGDKAMAALKGYKWMSPRGPVMIDPDTRDIVQNVYIRKVEKKDGKLWNVEFDKIPDVKDPGKEAAK
jgi:ABC-type branched-subunit amino acid transport system substrate-binding protein